MKSSTFTKTFLTVSILALAMMGCSSDDEESSAASSTVIAGSLSGGGSSKVSFQKLGGLAVTDYKVRCITLSGEPQAGEGEVGADGSFSLSISVSEAAPIGCFIVKIADSSVAASFSFESSQQSMNGSSTAKGSMVAAPGESINIPVTFDADKGTATVNESQITRAGGSGGGSEVQLSGTWADRTGLWTMTCINGSDFECPE